MRKKRELLSPLSCPFCGALPVVIPWHGGGPKKCIVYCDNDGCKVHPQVTGSTRGAAVKSWNYRNNATAVV